MFGIFLNAYVKYFLVYCPKNNGVYDYDTLNKIILIKFAYFK